MIVKHSNPNAEIKNVSTHTLFSILYDQGLVGFATFFIMLFTGLKLGLKFYKSNKYGDNNFLIYRLSFLLFLLSGLRFLFYYHTVHRWHYLVAIIFMNTSYYLYKKKTNKDILSF